jgi:hypothetical protein
MQHNDSRPAGIPQQRFRQRAGYLRLMLGFAALGAAGAIAGPAAERSSFNIPAQDLATGLVEFAEQAGVQLVASAGDIGTRRTAGVSGSFTSEEALRQLRLRTDYHR